MSDSIPPHGGPHSIAPASIDYRLRSGRSHEVAKIFWWIILSHAPWAGDDWSTWSNNLTLALDAGLMWSNPEQQAERAMKRLKAEGMLTSEMCQRPKADRKYGRMLHPQIAAPVKVRVPPRGAMTNVWITCKEARERPAALVTLLTGMYVLAAHETGEHLVNWSRVPGSIANLRRFVGACRGSTFDRRLRTLEDLQLVHVGRDIRMAPPSEWYQTFRAMRKHARDRAA